MVEGFAINGTPIWPQAGRKWRFLLSIALAEGLQADAPGTGKDLRVEA
ncbi:hypothetical protein [Microvirga vignae]|nr:hypothetical protein [Microvirga vignae]